MQIAPRLLLITPCSRPGLIPAVRRYVDMTWVREWVIMYMYYMNVSADFSILTSTTNDNSHNSNNNNSTNPYRIFFDSNYFDSSNNHKITELRMTIDSFKGNLERNMALKYLYNKYERVNDRDALWVCICLPNEASLGTYGRSIFS